MAGSLAQTSIFLSPTGNDSNLGDNSARPLATLEEALDRIHLTSAAGNGNLINGGSSSTILFEGGGTYGNGQQFDINVAGLLTLGLYNEANGPVTLNCAIATYGRTKIINAFRIGNTMNTRIVFTYNDGINDLDGPIIAAYDKSFINLDDFIVDSWAPIGGNAQVLYVTDNSKVTCFTDAVDLTSITNLANGTNTEAIIKVDKFGSLRLNGTNAGGGVGFDFQCDATNWLNGGSFILVENMGWVELSIEPADITVTNLPALNDFYGWRLRNMSQVNAGTTSSGSGFISVTGASHGAYWEEGASGMVYGLGGVVGNSAFGLLVEDGATVSYRSGAGFAPSANPVNIQENPTYTRIEAF